MASAEIPSYAALAELRTTSIPEKQLVLLKPVFTRAYERKIKLKSNDTTTYSIIDSPDDVLQKARIAHGRSMMHLSNRADPSMSGSKRASMVRLQAEDYLHARPDSLLDESESEYGDYGDEMGNEAGCYTGEDPLGPPSSSKSATMAGNSRIAAAADAAGAVMHGPVLLPSRSYGEGRLLEQGDDEEEEDGGDGVPPIIMIHGPNAYDAIGVSRTTTMDSDTFPSEGGQAGHCHDKGDRSVRGGRANAAPSAPVGSSAPMVGSAAVVFSDGAHPGEERLADQLINQLRKLGCGPSGATSGPVQMPSYGDFSARAGRHYIATAAADISISSPSFGTSTAIPAAAATPGAFTRDPSVRRRGSTSGAFTTPGTITTEHYTHQRRVSNTNIRSPAPLIASGGGSSVTEPLHLYPHGPPNGPPELMTSVPRFNRHSMPYMDATASPGAPENGHGNGNGNGTRNGVGSTGRAPDRSVRGANRTPRGMSIPFALAMTLSRSDAADANPSFRGSPARVASIGGGGGSSLGLHYHMGSRSAAAAGVAAEGDGNGVQLPDLLSNAHGSPQPASAMLFKAITGVQVTARGGLHDYPDQSVRSGRAASQLQLQHQQQLLARAASGCEEGIQHVRVGQRQSASHLETQKSYAAGKLPKIHSAGGSPASSAGGAPIPARRNVRDALGDEWLGSKSSGDLGRASGGSSGNAVRQKQDIEVTSGIVSKVKGLFSLLKR